MSTADTIQVENGIDVILTLLYAGGSRKKRNEEIIGNTRLDKLIFLLERETNFAKYLENFKFEPYNFGPFSSEVFDAIQALENAGLVKEDSRKNNVYLDEADRYQNEDEAGEESDVPKATIQYSLTEKGEQVGAVLFESLSREEQEQLSKFKSEFNSLELRRLIQYVYGKYPEFTTESKIKDSVF